MKVLVSTEKRCLERDLNGLEFFTRYTVVTGTVIEREFTRVGFRAELPSYLKESGIDVLLCHGIDEATAQELAALNIEVYTKVGEDPDKAIANYLEKELGKAPSPASKEAVNHETPDPEKDG